MDNHYENERQIHPAPEVQAGANHELEQKLHALVTPERARLIVFAATKNRDTLSTKATTPQTDLEIKIKDARADDLPFEAGESVSEKRREDYWKEEVRGNLSFAEQNKQWNEGIHQAILNLIAVPQGNDQQKARKAELAKETLQHLGLTGSVVTQEKAFYSKEKGLQEFDLFSDVEAFRNTYFDRKSDIKGFVKKIAEQCPNVDGSVDITMIKERLDAIRPLLTTFGDQSVDDLVEDYAISYGLLTQKNQQVKAKIADETKNKLQSEITDTKRKIVFEEVIKKQEEIDREKAVPQQPAAEPEPQTQTLPTESSGTEQFEENVKGGEPVVETEVQEEHPEREDVEERIKRIERRLRKMVTIPDDIVLSPKQRKIIQNMTLTEKEFFRIFLDQYRELQVKAELGFPRSSHDEIMKDLDIMFDNINITNDGKTINVIARGFDGKLYSIEYPRIQ